MLPGTFALLVASLPVPALHGLHGAGPLGDAGVSAACVAVKGEARSNGYGFKHVVVLTSSCAKIADCAVSTDVNPKVEKVEVAPKATVEVITWFDSPSSAFVPNVQCTVRK